MRSHTLGPVAALSLAVLLPAAPAHEVKEPKYAGKPLSGWLEQLRSGKTLDRRRAAATLWAHISPEDRAAVPALIKALTDEDAQVRSQAAAALGEIGKEARPAVPALLKALNDPAVRARAVSALGSISPERATAPALIEAIKNPATRASAMTVLALGRFGPAAKAAVPALIDAVKDKDRGSRL